MVDTRKELQCERLDLRHVTSYCVVCTRYTILDSFLLTVLPLLPLRTHTSQNPRQAHLQFPVCFATRAANDALDKFQRFFPLAITKDYHRFTTRYVTNIVGSKKSSPFCFYNSVSNSVYTSYTYSQTLYMIM